MGRNLNAFKTLAYQGVRPGTPPNMVLNVRRPTLKDYIEYEIGDLWVIPKKGPDAPAIDPTSEVWILVSKRYSQGIWKRIHGHGGGPSGPFVINQIVISTPGAGTYTPSTNMAEVQIEIIGGGGGGGGSGEPFPEGGGPGGGGGAAGYVSKIFSSTDIGASQSYFIGSGGNGGVGNANAPDGTDSTFASGSLLMTASGGKGGAAATPAALTVGAGYGGAASGGSLNIAGQAGFWPAIVTGLGVQTVPSGAGGSTIYGAGGYPVWTGTGGSGAAADGLNGNGYGSGGGGAWTTVNSPAYEGVGGRGANGVLIITEYLS